MNDNLPPLPPCVPDLNRLTPFVGGLGKAILQELIEDMAALAAAPHPQPVPPTDSMGIPECRGPLCAPNDHHPLCSHKPQPVQEQCPECDGTGTVAGSQAHFPCPICTSTQEAQPQPVQEPVAPVGTVTRYLGNDGYMKWAFQPEAAAWLVPRDQRAAERGAESCFSVYTSPQAQPQPVQPLKPDMFWNSDDADQPHDSIECFLNDQICQHDLEVGAVFTIWRAKKLPSLTIRVTAIDEEECEAEYEVIERAHGITKGTT